VTGSESDIVGAHRHGSIGFTQSSVQLLGSAELYHQPVGIEYSGKGRLGKLTRPNRALERIDGENAQHALAAKLVQVKGKGLGFCIPRGWAGVHVPSCWFSRHLETSPLVNGANRESFYCGMRSAVNPPRAKRGADSLLHGARIKPAPTGMSQA
jgi:hypothetical protein